MSSIPVTIALPDELEEAARRRGLLTPEAIERLLRSELARLDAAERIKRYTRLLEDDGEPAMSMEEIQAEVDAVRAARRGRHARGS